MRQNCKYQLQYITSMHHFRRGEFHMHGMGVDYSIQYCLLVSFMLPKWSSACRNDHTILTALLPVCSAKLNIVRISQYYCGGPSCDPECGYLCCLLFFQTAQGMAIEYTLNNEPLMFVVQGVTQVLNFHVIREGGKKISYLHSLPCFVIFEVQRRN